MSNKKGFTLIELLIAISLVAVVGLLLFSFIGQGFTLYAMETNSSAEQMNMRQVLSDITNRARLADPAAITYVSGTLNIGSDSYTFTSGKVKRNASVIAKDISSFVVNLNAGILEIKIVHNSGKSLSTSISLLD